MTKTVKQEDVVSELKIVDFYFTEISFKNKRLYGDSKVQISYTVNGYRCDNGNVRVEVITTVNGEDQGIFLEIKAEGIFDTSSVQDVEKKKFMEEIATVTAMMPYIRSQVTLLTTQPGITQLILPPIDVYKLVEQSKKIGNEN